MSTPDYRLHDPRGWMGDPSRGAAMGRPHLREHDAEFDGRIHIRESQLNGGGYDRLGTYFGDPGTGETLFWVASADGKIDYMQWAHSRLEVETAARKAWPLAQIRRTSFSAERWRQMRKPGRAYLIGTPVTT